MIKVTLNEKGLVHRIDRDEKPGWLDKPIKPAMPESLLPVVNRYQKGSPVSKNIELIPVSGQMWQGLFQQEKEQLLELAEFLGIGAENYVKQFQSMLPRNPGGHGG